MLQTTPFASHFSRGLCSSSNEAIFHDSNHTTLTLFNHAFTFHTTKCSPVNSRSECNQHNGVYFKPIPTACRFSLNFVQGAPKPHQRTRSAPSVSNVAAAADAGVPASSLPALTATGTAATASGASSSAASSAGRRTRASKRPREEETLVSTDAVAPGAHASTCLEGASDTTGSPTRRAAKRGRTGAVQDTDPCKKKKKMMPTALFQGLCYTLCRCNK